MRMMISTMGLFALFLMTNDVLAQEFSDAEFRHLHKSMRPAPNEAYLSIPWKISLLDAQRVAAKKQKPIFIWAMDGHPLGCT